MDSGGKSIVNELRQARDRGVLWLMRRIGEDGTPAAADQGAGWGRVPWALALSGETAAAAAVLGWAERNALDADGGFREGPARGNGVMLAYPLSHLAIGAWLTERYDMALAIMRKLASLQFPATGGIGSGYVGPGGAEIQDLLLTAQVGIAALVTGQDALIDSVHRWVRSLYADQPSLPDRLYSMREGPTLLTAPPAAIAWLGAIDFRLPRQSFYNPGIAAAFLAGVAMRRGDTGARDLGAQFLELNIRGTPSQFDDREAVQICKFGWGASTMLLADPGGPWLKHVMRMADWFIACQDEDGGWSPSRFLIAQPGEVVRMMKTAEHVMELNTMLAALGTARGRQVG
jgi:hypothetical protein